MNFNKVRYIEYQKQEKARLEKEERLRKYRSFFSCIEDFFYVIGLVLTTALYACLYIGIIVVVLHFVTKYW